MSKVDDYEREKSTCARLEEDVKVICKLKHDQIQLPEEVTKALEGFGVKEFLAEAIQTPEFRKILVNILELRVQRARNDAVEECQRFLQKHVVAEVMES